MLNTVTSRGINNACNLLTVFQGINSFPVWKEGRNRDVQCQQESVVDDGCRTLLRVELTDDGFFQFWVSG